MYNKGVKGSKILAGQSIVEVVIALAMISTILITLVTMAALSIRASTFARNQTEASRFTGQAAEWLRSEKDASWTVFKSHAVTPNWCLDSLYWNKANQCSSSSLISGTIFTRNLKFINNPDGSIEADVLTTWADAQGTHTSPTSIVFTNWK